MQEEQAVFLARFGRWGLASYLGIGTALAVGAFGAAVQRWPMRLAEGIQGRLVLLVVCSAALGFMAGWVAISYGRRLPCERCGSDLMPKELGGFQGLRLRPVLAALKGRALCPRCVGNGE